MKNFVLSFLLFFPQLVSSQTIQEFYNLFEHAERKPSQNTADNQVLIDEKNAFIKIQNPQEPDDAISFKAFTKADGSKVFGFQYSTSQRGLDLIRSKTEFYIFKADKWQEVSDEVCPSLGFENFWGAQPLPTNLLREFNLHLNLPQIGTTVVAKSEPAIAVQFPYSNLPTGYSETFKKRKFKNIELNWNKISGKFEVGKKS